MGSPGGHSGANLCCRLFTIKSVSNTKYQTQCETSLIIVVIINCTGDVPGGDAVK